MELISLTPIVPMFRQRFNSFKYALEGVLELIKSQPNFRIHLVASILVLFMGWFFAIEKSEWCFTIFAIVLVLTAEALNTGLEYITDLVSPDYHLLAEKTKDVAAAGVLIAAMGAAVVGLIIFLPKLMQYFF